jgi:phytanoyl-CoA hydroxylase
MKINTDFFKKNGYLLLNDFLPKQEIELVLIDAKKVFLKQFIEKKYISHCSIDEITEAQFNSFLYRLFEDDFECL